MSDTKAPPTVRNFFPGGQHQDPTHGTYDGTVIIHRDNYDRRLSTLVELGDELIAECAQFDPPLHVTREDIKFEMYGGDRHKRQMGAEVKVPYGTEVPERFFHWKNLGTVEAGYPTI